MEDGDFLPAQDDEYESDSVSSEQARGQGLDDVQMSFVALTDSIKQGRELKSREKERDALNERILADREELEDREDILANYHYLVRPTREPDVAADKFIINFLPGTSRLNGPVYLIPQVILAKNPFVRAQSFYASDTQYKAVFRGTYTKLDDSVVKGTTISNKRIEAGTYMLNDEGLYVQNTEPAEVKAFSSWVEAITPEDKPLTFYLDGESLNPTAIADLHIAQPAETTTDDGIYDLGGRRVGTMPADRSRLKPGMYVIQGRKVIIK